MPTITYTTPGSYTFTVPAGVTSIIVEAISKGGLGGFAENANYDGLYSGTVAGGGGGGGAYGKATQSVTPGQVVDIYIPTNLADPFVQYVRFTIGINAIMYVQPGANGYQGVYYDQFDNLIDGYGGNPGYAEFGASATNTISYSGGWGANGGAGGGAAGTTGAGGAAFGSTGGTGASLYGGNGGNAGFFPFGNGFSGSNYGGGGGGGKANAASGYRSGGLNGGAWAAITYTEPPPPVVGNGRFFPFF